LIEFFVFNFPKCGRSRDCQPNVVIKIIVTVYLDVGLHFIVVFKG